MLKALLKVNAAALLNWLSGSGKRSGKGKSSKGKMIVYGLLMLAVRSDICSAGSTAVHGGQRLAVFCVRVYPCVCRDVRVQRFCCEKQAL